MNKATPVIILLVIFTFAITPLEAKYLNISLLTMYKINLTELGFFMVGLFTGYQIGKGK